jgi:hypothetical protein
LADIERAGTAGDADEEVEGDVAFWCCWSICEKLGAPDVSADDARSARFGAGFAATADMIAGLRPEVAALLRRCVMVVLRVRVIVRVKRRETARACAGSLSR